MGNPDGNPEGDVGGHTKRAHEVLTPEDQSLGQPEAG
jgi:hypothetical protein